MRLRRVMMIMAVLGALALTIGEPAWAANGGRPFRVELSGANQVPPTPAGDADRVTAVLRLNQGQGRVCFAFGPLTLSSGPLPSHGGIHRAPAGAVGPPALPLFGHGDYPQSYPTEEVCVEADRALIKDIRKNPQDYYLYFDNHAYPQGLLRGQLSG